jgi:hypothetical protein
MTTIRVQATAESDGELHLRGLPISRGETAEVIVFTASDDDATDEALIQILTHDPAWAWLKDPAEDVYTEQDIRR